MVWRAGAGGHSARAAVHQHLYPTDLPGGGSAGHADGGGPFVPEDQELPRVMNEILEALGGCGATLTIHPQDGRAPQVIYADAVVTEPLAARLTDAGTLWPLIDPGDMHGWRRCNAADLSDIFVMPVQRVEGHSRLVISIFFDHPTPDDRARAEAAYLRRRPFAVGYFRLWQKERTSRRMTDVLQAAINLTAIGIVLINGEGEMVFANTAALDLTKSGGGLRERHGRIMATSLRDSARLQAAIDHVLAAEDGKGRRLRAPMLAVRREGKGALIVSVFPTPHGVNEPSDVSVILFVVDPTVDVEQLLEPVCKLFQLSHVETRLACLLASGTTLQEAAAKLHIKEPTARGYLKQIFIKTGTNRQAALMRIMLSSLMRTTPDVTFDVM